MGEKRINSLPSTYMFIFSFRRERLIEEKNEGWEGVGGEGDVSSAECLGNYPIQR